MAKNVILTTKDGVEIPVERNEIKMSSLIRDMLEDSSEDEVPMIPLPNCESRALQKILEYCKYHWNNKADEIEKPLKGKVEDSICEFDRKFLEIDQELLIELIMGANYLDINDLLNLTCAKVASMIKGKTPEEIRQMFNITNDFTPDEEDKIREENKWCEES